jgi:hypothetical protein
MKIGPEVLSEHGAEFSYLLNHYLTEHLARVSRAFEGDLTAALVLGTIAHQNLRRFHDHVISSTGKSMQAMIRDGEHRELMRPCNAASVAASTGIPRETVRRKVAWLAGRGWVRREGRDQLFVDERAGADFAQFNLATVEMFAEMLTRFAAATSRRQPAAAQPRRRAVEP